MKKTVWLALLMGAILLSACGGEFEGGNSAPPLTQRPTEQVFKGYGNDVTRRFTLKVGLAEFEYAHTGTSNFIVWLLDEEGNEVDLIVNEIGDYSGASATRIRQEGRYLLEVTADEGWAVIITQ